MPLAICHSEKVLICKTA